MILHQTTSFSDLWVLSLKMLINGYNYADTHTGTESLIGMAKTTIFHLIFK